MRELTIISEMNEVVPAEAIRYTAKTMIAQLMELIDDADLDD